MNADGSELSDLACHVEQAQLIYRLHAAHARVSSLTGLNLLSNLRALDLSHNQLQVGLGCLSIPSS